MVFSTTPKLKDAVRSFYAEECQLVEEQRTLTFRPRGNSASASIAFEVEECVESEVVRPSVFWKIGLAVSDVDVFGSKFSVVGSQFVDIGYLAHITDPAGNCVELLQIEKDGGMPFAVGQISLRVSDAEKSIAFYKRLGMKLIARMPVDSHGFTLHFLAFSGDDCPPNPSNLEALENRPWCYSRPYTTLELLHYHKPTKITQSNSSFRCIEIVLPDGLNSPSGGAHQIDNKTLRDPDGVLIRIAHSSHSDNLSR